MAERSRPIISKTSNIEGPTAWPVNIVREALIKRPAFTDDFSANERREASAVAGGGKVYFTNEDGDVFVVKAGSTYELLAENHMGDVSMATPAIAGNTLLYRTQHHLFALAESTIR